MLRVRVCVKLPGALSVTPACYTATRRCCVRRIAARLANRAQVGRIYAIVMHVATMIAAGAVLGAALCDMVKSQVNRKWNLVVRSRRVFVARLLGKGRGGASSGGASGGGAHCGDGGGNDGAEASAEAVQEALAWSYGSAVAQWRSDAAALGVHLAVAAPAFICLVVGGGLALYFVQLTNHGLALQVDALSAGLNEAVRDSTLFLCESHEFFLGGARGGGVVPSSCHLSFVFFFSFCCCFAHVPWVARSRGAPPLCGVTSRWA